MIKKQFNKFEEISVRNCLKHAFTHELFHIYEKNIMLKFNKTLDKILEKVGGNMNFSKEFLSEIIEDIIGPSDDCNKISNILWYKLSENMKQYNKQKDNQ